MNTCYYPREHNPNITRLIYLLLLAQQRGKPDVSACIRAVREGLANHVEVVM